MSNTYRIKAVSPSEYIVQKPFLHFFWCAALYVRHYCYSGHSFKDITRFPTVDEAQAALDAHIEKMDAIEAHVSQVPIYVTYASKDKP